jgi:hypothetical protein
MYCPNFITTIGRPKRCSILASLFKLIEYCFFVDDDDDDDDEEEDKLPQEEEDDWLRYV